MDLPLNYDQPITMHIDLNSCFAIIEQQANPLIRNKPVAVAAYDTPKGAVLAASYEAKALGVRLMLNVREARRLCPGLIVMMPDPEKYFDAHRRFKKVLLNYTDEVTPKSIDEFVVNFAGSRAIQNGLPLEEVGYRIKADIKESLGEYVTVNIGIATNRFLAKVASSLNKPDGLDVINAEHIRDMYSQLALDDLPGINSRFRARLNMAGIYTPLQFLDAPVWKLKNEVFHGIVGFYWYLRLRGYEIDSVDFGRKSFGQQYALGNKTRDPQELYKLLMKLCEKTGRRLRKGGYIASGVHLYLTFENRTSWSQGKKLKKHIYSTQDIFLAAQRLLDSVPIPARVTNISVTVYGLQPSNPEQLGLFDDTRLDTRSLAKAADIVNDRYGEFTVVPAIMANMQDVILKRIAFGNVKEIYPSTG
jgi:DNA polymerase-4